MSRGAFASSKLNNSLISTPGPFTLYHPTQEILPIFDAATLYKKKNIDTVIIAGKDYGCGSSRDSAAKGPMLIGVKAIIAQSFERIHRSNLIGVGVLAIEVEEEIRLKGDEEVTKSLKKKKQKIIYVKILNCLNCDFLKFNLISFSLD